MSVSDKLGNFAQLGWVWNHGPWWAFFIALAFGWVAMNMIALVIESRMLIPREQYYSFYYGDIALSIAVGLIASMAKDLHGGWYRANWCQWLVLAAGIAGGLGQVAVEIMNRQYTLAQFISPTKLWHNVILWPVMAYWVCTGTAAITTEAGISPVKVVGVYLCVAAWFFFAVYDADPKHAKPMAHINFNWLRI